MKKSELNNLIREKTQSGIDQLMFRATDRQRRAMVTVVRETVKGLTDDIQKLENPIEVRMRRILEIDKTIQQLQRERDNLIENL